ncbi:hypothetical protein [Bacillus mycoides]|uniref:hypothetical protein n=1 Tax=Bacillus mycoides TaxID=1405 RepID=UPI003D65BC40
MSEQLIPETTYLVSVGNLFVSHPQPLMVTRLPKSAMEFEYGKAKQVATNVGGVVIRKNVEFNEMVEF